MSLTSALTTLLESSRELAARHAVAEAAYSGLTAAPKMLSPWMFYDEAGSALFEEITRLPEYYLTRTERALLARYADEILDICGACTGGQLESPLQVIELGAGTATKTGILLKSLTERQLEVRYQPIDISPTALDEAAASLTALCGVAVEPCVANYVTDSVSLDRSPDDRVLALYIGSSIGNFSPSEARGILQNLRDNLQRGDMLLLGTDLAPSTSKSVDVLLAAYNDAAGVTAAFNRNILRRLNRDLGANFQVERFRHYALWNQGQSRIEMHLQSACAQRVRLPQTEVTPAATFQFLPGETIHTENSYKFTGDSIATLLADCGFSRLKTFVDDEGLFAVTLAGVR